jgi:hypothetical protein
MRLRDITWGGRIRSVFQPQVWSIANEVAVRREHRTEGSMVSSASFTTLHFLDGGVTEGRGFLGPSCGMFWSGTRAKAYILYRLGFDAPALLLKGPVPDMAELSEELEAQRRAAEVSQRAV